MVEQSGPRKPTLTHFEVRRTLFREAIKAGAHKKDPEFLPVNGWAHFINLLAIYYLTEASTEEIATHYRMKEDNLDLIIRAGTVELWHNSPLRIQSKYSLAWRNWSTVKIEKPRTTRSVQKAVVSEKTPDVKCANSSQTENLPLKKKQRERKSVNPQKELAPTASQPDVLIDGETDDEPVEERLDQFSNDFDLYNIARKKDWFILAIRRNLIDEEAVRRLKEFFEEDRGRPTEADLNALSEIVVKFDDGF